MTVFMPDKGPHVECAAPQCPNLIPMRRAEIGYVNCPPCQTEVEANDPYVQVCYGFKNNGANLVRASQREAHMEGVKVRG